jgi:hypothetical protein
MFKWVNKRKHAVSRKKDAWKLNNYKGFLAISTPLPARRQRFHFAQFLKFSTFKWENAEEIYIWKLNIEVFELFPGPNQ